MAMAQNMLVSVLFLLLASGDGAMIPPSGEAEGAIQSAAVPQEEVQVQAAFTAANQTEAGGPAYFTLPQHSTSALSMVLTPPKNGLKCAKWNRLGKIEDTVGNYGKVLQQCKQQCLDDGKCKAISGSRQNYGGKSWCVLCKTHLTHKHVGWNTQEAQHTDAFKKAVWTCGGNAGGDQCLESFKYNGVQYKGCIHHDNDRRFWCYTKHGYWGNCHLPQEPYNQQCKSPSTDHIHWPGVDMGSNTCGPGSFSPCQAHSYYKILKNLNGMGTNSYGHVKSEGCPDQGQVSGYRWCHTVDGRHARCASNDEYCDYMEPS